MAGSPPGVVSAACNPAAREKFRSLFAWVSLQRNRVRAGGLGRLLLAEERDARRERVCDDFQFAQLGMGEIGAGVGGGLTFARNLNHGGHFAFLQDWRAHDFLDSFAALVFGDGHGFENRRMWDHREMIDYLRALFTHGA